MFLITTADQRFWKTDGKILFLGEWCRVYDQKSVWFSLESEVLPYHWESATRFNQDIEVLSSLGEKILLDLAPKMNELHEVNYSTRYWRIVLGAWLFQFIEIFYDRYKSVLKATRSGATHTWIPSFDPSECIPKDFDTFYQWCVQDSYNQVVYGWIIKQLNQIRYEIKGGIENFPSHENAVYDKGLKWKIIPKKILERFSRCVPDGFNQMVFYGSYIRPWDLARLQLSLGQVPYLRRPEITIKEVPVNSEKRKSLQLSFSEDSFEALLEKIIPMQIPKIYIEGYIDMSRRSLDVFPKSLKLIYTAVGLYGHEGFKFWAARQVERGVKFVVGQHGGSYGSSRVNTYEKHEVSCSDLYFSWGWQDHNLPKVTPMPSGQLERVNKTIKPDLKGDVLMVGMERPLYFWFGISFPMGTNIVRFLEDQEQFVKGLSTEVRRLLVIRLYHFDRGWAVEERWKKFDPTITVTRGGKSVFHQLNRSRLAINTYNSTFHLETLSANFPTLFFWRPEYFEIRKSAQRDFEEMLDAEIFHSSPESAAAKVNEIYHDPMAWWSSSEVQEARKRFCRKYARTSKTWRSELKNKLLSLVEE